MNTEQTVRGYRILGDRKPEKELNTEYIRLKTEPAHALNNLRHAVATKGANCTDREDEFSGETLPDDRDAQLMCAGCDSFTECDIFLKLGHPAYGVWAGKVKGREMIWEDE